MEEEGVRGDPVHGEQAERVADESIGRLDARLMAAYTNAYLSLRWFDPARPHVSLHVRKHLNRLLEGYLARAQVPGDPLHEWLGQRIDLIPENAGDIGETERL
ncbi:MAG: hypothetical protein ACRDN6_05375 [Gaiellaceae bacterium]